MQLFEREIDIPIVEGHVNLREYFRQQVAEILVVGEIPVRFAVTSTTATHYRCEIGVLAGFDDARVNQPTSIFDFVKRGPESIDAFNVALLVPTGVGSEIGGHAGDAGPVTRLFGAICDTVITHPNVVNASDINELPENGLYVESPTVRRCWRLRWP